MNARLDPTLSPFLWMALSLAIGAMAAQLSFAWIEQAPARDLPARLRGLAAAGLSLGTGIWSAHGLAASIAPVGFVVGYHPWVEGVLWFLAVGASMDVLGGSDVKLARLPPW